MALKPIFEIEISDAKFKAFLVLFNKYQAQLKQLPGQWGMVNAQIGDTKSAVSGVTEEAKKHDDALKNQAESAKTTNAIARSTAVVWSTIASSAQNVGHHISDATRSLAKWSTLTAVVSGLLGVGGLFGIDRLASVVAAQRRTAMGLGVSYGQNNAFNTNYQRLINPGSLLSNVSTAKYDMTSPQYTALMTSGVSQSTIKNGNAATISSELLSRLPGLFAGMDKNDRGLIGAKAHAYGIDNLMSMQDLIAFLNASPEERKSMAERTAQDAKAMDLGEEAQRKWQDLITQLSRAGTLIENSFAEKLSRIAPSLEHLSDVFVNAVEKLAKSDVLKDLIGGLADGLDSFAKQIDTPAFQSGVENFAKWVGQAAEGLWKFIESFSTPDAAGSGAASAYYAGGGPGASFNSGTATAAPSSTRSPYGDLSTSPFLPGEGSARALTQPGGQSGPFASPEAEKDFVKKAAAARGIPFEDIDQIFQGEGGYNPNWKGGGDDGSSFGPFQLHYKGMSQRYPNSGAGDLFTEETGLSAKTNETTPQQIEWALNYIAKHGYGPWYVSPGLDNPHRYLNGRGPPPGSHEVPIHMPQHEEYNGAGRQPTVHIRPNTGNNPANSAFMVAHPSAPVGAQQ